MLVSTANYEMDKQNQVLVLQPNDKLQFRGSFKDAVTAYLKLMNISDKNILYRVKAISPYKFCLRPKSGSLESKFYVNVAVCVQPFDFPFQDTDKHEIIVQHFVAPSGEVNSEELWAYVRPDEIKLSKVECAFDFGEPYCSTSRQQVTAEHETLSTGLSQTQPSLQSSFDIDSNISKKISETSKCMRTEFKDVDYITNTDNIGEYEEILVMSTTMGDNLNKEESSIRRVVSLEGRSKQLENDNYQLRQELIALKELQASLYSSDRHTVTSTKRNLILFVVVSVIFLLIGIAIGKYFLSSKK